LSGGSDNKEQQRIERLRKMTQQILSKKYIKIIEENKMYFKNYKSRCLEAAIIETGGKINDKEDIKDSSE